MNLDKLSKRDRQKLRKANACTRCKSQFEHKNIFQNICDACLEKSPKLTAAEKSAINSWDSIDMLRRIIEIAENGENYSDHNHWSWVRNTSCKYLDIRVDMRDGGCIVKDGNGERIGIDALNWQWSNETPDRPKT